LFLLFYYYWPARCFAAGYGRTIYACPFSNRAAHLVCSTSSPNPPVASCVDAGKGIRFQTLMP
jgi:hypothetical protein